MSFQEFLARPEMARALGYAIARHGDQKWGQDPYQVHLLKVAEVVYDTIKDEPNLLYREIVVAGALLHDVVEDTDTSLHDIAIVFGGGVADIVKACTKEDSELCRRCSFRKTVPLLKANSNALLVKLADRLVNMQKSLADRSTHLNMYVREYAEFKALLWKEGQWPTVWKALDEVFEAGKEKKK